MLFRSKAAVSKNISSVVRKKGENAEAGAEYNLNTNETPRKILMSMIHENSYWNHHLYGSTFLILASTISIAIIILIVTTLFALPLINIDPEYTVPRLAFTFLSFSLIYEFLEKALTSYSSSKIMLEIDNELSREKQDITEEHLLKIFNQYCDIKEAAPNIPNFVYNSNKGKLNRGWDSRLEIKNESNA